MSSKRRTPQGEKMHRWSIKHRTATIGADYSIKREARLKNEAQRNVRIPWIENATVLARRDYIEWLVGREGAGKENHEQEG
jgi:hypothetical protein